MGLAGPGSHAETAEVAAKPTVAAPRRFAALRNRDCRPYLFGALLAMMADNIEHVITYWVLWQRFHSPALAGFQVTSHWVPFLLFSVYFGALAALCVGTVFAGAYALGGRTSTVEAS